MARGGWPITVLSVLLLATVQATTTAPALANAHAHGALLDAAPAYDAQWATGFKDAMAWSVTHQDRYVAPLVPGAALQGWHHDAITASDQGRTWAKTFLANADENTLVAELDTLLTAHGLDATITTVDHVPPAFIPPIATLLAAQRITTDHNTNLPDPTTHPWTYTRELGTQGAWLLGTLDTVVPELHLATTTSSQLPTEPILVDPLGLVILGGTGDNTYDHPTLPARWMRPTLLIEPDGDDTYNVPVASNFVAEIDVPLIGTIRNGVTSGAIAIDLNGNDHYTKDAAQATATSTVLLLDENGNDTYGQTTIRWAVASANPGQAILLDRSGNDHYNTKDKGLAYANHGLALLADWNGDDTYTSNLVLNDGLTHAAAENIGSLAILRDYDGDDTSSAFGLAYGSSEDDSTTLFIDDQGADVYYATWLVGGEFGQRYRSEGGLQGPLNRGLGYFIDGKGNDAYTYGQVGTNGDPSTFGNELTRVICCNDDSWGAFTDCTTPAEAEFPCQDEHDDILLAIVTS